MGLTAWGGPISYYDPPAVSYPVVNQINLPVVDHEPDVSALTDQAQMCNFSLKYNLYTKDLSANGAYRINNPWFLFYIIDDEGNLFVQNEWIALHYYSSKIYVTKVSPVVTTADSVGVYEYDTLNAFSYVEDMTNIWLTVYVNDNSQLVGAAQCSSTDFTKKTSMITPVTTGVWYNIDTMQPFTGDVSQIQKAGCLYMKDYFWDNNNINSHIPESFSYFFQNQTATKTVTGNSELSANLARIMGLDASTPVTVTASDWFIEGTPIGEYLGSTVVLNSGEYADIATIADIDPLAFNVVVPLSLPVYVNNVGEVFVADNAVITNRSSAAVAIQDLSVSSSNAEGWKLVDNPSKDRDAKEFSFTSTLQKNTILQPDENLSFTYDVQLSPCTEGAQSLDLSSLRVTLCWADELTP